MGKPSIIEGEETVSTQRTNVWKSRINRGFVPRKRVMNGPPSAPTSLCGRSVNDFVDVQGLREALGRVSTDPADPSHLHKRADWMLPVPNDQSHEPTPEDELQRLLTLRSYMALDVEGGDEFDQLTAEACRHFQVPTALIALVDLGRQFFFSRTGWMERETPRHSSFCTHVIVNKSGIVCVHDASKDPRFQNNPEVTGAPFVRFFAGTPRKLISAFPVAFSAIP